DDRVGPVDDDGHPAHTGYLGRAHRQALDIEPPPPEQAGDAIQDAGPVFDQGDQRMLWRRHTRTSSGIGSSIMSATPMPLGIMGKQFSSSSTLNSMSTGPGSAFARSRTGPTWFLSR